MYKLIYMFMDVSNGHSPLETITLPLSSLWVLTTVRLAPIIQVTHAFLQSSSNETAEFIGTLRTLEIVA